MSTARASVRPTAAVLHDIDWGTYTRLLRAFERRRGFRLTYDRGILEIMSPLWEHERPAYLTTALVIEFRDWVQRVLLGPTGRE